jgi:hypothetical protein
MAKIVNFIQYQPFRKESQWKETKKSTPAGVDLYLRQNYNAAVSPIIW